MSKILIIACCLGWNSYLMAKTKVNKAIVDNQVFDLVKLEKLTCGENISSPEYKANQFMIKVAFDLGVRTNNQKEGIEGVFRYVRGLPSRFSSATCATLRDECEMLCEKTAAHKVDVCKIECNQYEIWNQ